MRGTIGERSLIRDESGGATMWLLFWTLGFIILGGVAVDSSNGWRMRAELQATADAAAHAAAISLPDRSAATDAALTFAAVNMPTSRHGHVLRAEDVEFGVWDPDARSFTPDALAGDAVRVTVQRTKSNGNAVRTYLLRLAGASSWDVAAQAVAERYWPECLNDGLFARGQVDIRSNEVFTNAICVHSQDHVEVNNNNFWGAKVSVSMPDIADFGIPIGGWESNVNIENVLHAEWFDPKLVDRIAEIVEGMQDPNSDWAPAFLAADAPLIAVSRLQDFDPGALQPGAIYVISCGGPNKNINMGAGATVSDVVLIADCKFSLGNNATYSDVVVASTAGDPSNPQEALISIGQGTAMGADDTCASGGGVTLISTASVIGAAESSYHGVQIITAGDISLAAGQGAIEGMQAQAGGEISITSNGAFGTCAGGVDPLKTPYYRLVQ